MADSAANSSAQPTAQPIIIDLLRHGAVAAEGWAFRGSTDIPLSDTGWQQMRRVADAFTASNYTFDQIATSPMQRCRRFAETLHGAPRILDDMREMDFGDWENRAFDDIQASDGALLAQFWQSPVGIQPPGGELFDDFIDRVIACWQAWLADAAGETRLLVAHGGVIRVILAHLLKMPMAAMWRLHLPYAAWSRVSLCAGHAPRLMFMNRMVDDACAA